MYSLIIAVRGGARGDQKVAPCPQVSPPELLPEVVEFLEEHPVADPFQPLDDHADPLVRTVGDQEVDMVACDLPIKGFGFMRQHNLAEEVADSEGNRTHEHRFPIIRDPDEVGFAV
jgi:hypothetical protein